MIGFPSGVRVYLAVEPHDMHKSFNGLYAIARELRQVVVPGPTTPLSLGILR